MANFGDERWQLITIDHRDVEAAARKRGWDGGEGVLDYCDANAEARCQDFGSLDTAAKAAREFLATGHSTFGAATIDHQRYERRVRGGSWEDVKCYEVAGECMEVDV